MANELAIAGSFTPDQVELIKRTVAVGATDDELQLFMYVAKKTGLDPFTRQIYALKRWNSAMRREVMAIQTGIDGYRVVADRTGKLAGITDPIFDDESKDHPNKATVTVKKMVEGAPADFTATARWTEYVQLSKEKQPTGMWVKMPYLMLGKCAEALALRKAFPADLSGVYTTEEMQQADNGQQEAAVIAEVERQKAAYTPDPQSAGMTMNDIIARKHDAAIPPELDWSYQKTTGVLICRITEAVAKSTAKKREYLVLKLNQPVEGQQSLTYFHNSHRAELLAAVGKVCKFMVSMSKDGKFVNIDEVLEIDGKHIDKAPDDSAEFKARALASTMDWTEDDLRELHTRWCHNSWEETLVRLEARQAELAGKMAPVTEEEIPF